MSLLETGTNDVLHRILHSSSGSGKSVGSNHPDQAMIGGIIVGYILFVFFVTVISTLHFFFPWGMQLKRKIPPETYLYAGIHSLGAMIVTGGILTKFWADIPSPSPLEEWYGYNNVCIVFDLVPSKYVMPSFWFVCGYFITRYAVEDSRRIFRMKEQYSSLKLYFCLTVNVVVAFICAFFSVCLAVGPDEDMIAHTTPFLCLILSLPLMYISHWLRTDKPSTSHTVAMTFYAVVSYIKASLTITALVATHVPGKYALFIDYLWMGGAVVAPFLFCPIYNDPDDASTNASDAKRASFHAATSTAPLVLPWIFVVFGNLGFNVVLGLFKRLFALIVCSAPHTKASKSKCPIASLYTGDIFGYFGFIFVGFEWLYREKQKHGPVFATNIGQPVVCLLDEQSVNVMLEDQDPASVSFVPSMVTASDADKNFNFYRSGPLAIGVRQLLMRLTPYQEDNEFFRLGFEGMKTEIESWTKGGLIHGLDIFEAVQKLIVVYSSTMLTGDRIDPDLADDASPVPMMLPNYPQFPKRLFPLYFKFRSAWGSMSKMVQNSRRWPEIKQIAKEVGLEDEDAINNVLSAACLNSLGLSNSMVNAFYLLNIDSKWNQELVQDEDLLESFAWELLRHNGPELSRKVTQPTTIKTPSGEIEVQSGTIVYSMLPLTLRDERIWKDPHMFKADRFLKQQDGSSEPKPTLGMGCPLKHYGNVETFKNSHHCVFLNTINPFLKAFVRMLVEDFQWRLDSKTKSRLGKNIQPHFVSVVTSGDGKVRRSLHADFSMEKLTCVLDLAKDMTPDLGKFHKPRFAFIESNVKHQKVDLPV